MKKDGLKVIGLGQPQDPFLKKNLEKTSYVEQGTGCERMGGRTEDILRRAGYGVGSPADRTEEEWDKKRCAFCATELASVIGRMGEWELHLEKDDWGKIDDELPMLEDEINMVGDACDLDVQEALGDYGELKESARNRDKEGVLAAMGKIEANTFYKLAKIAVKPRR